MRFWVGVSAALGVGGIAGFVAGMATIEGKLRKEYEEAAESRRRAFEMAQSLNARVITDIEDEVERQEEEFQANERTFLTDVFDPSMQPAFTPAGENPYHKAVAAEETNADIFTAGGINDYGVSYLEEEEYMEEDGSSKTQIALVFDNGDAHFFLNGEKIDDWDERLGASIVVDFIKYTANVTPEVLYVRNHKTGEDYEVMLERP